MLNNAAYHKQKLMKWFMSTNVEDLQNTGQVTLVHLINRLKWVLPTCASSLLQTLARPPLFTVYHQLWPVTVIIAHITLTLSCHDKSDEPSHTGIHTVYYTVQHKWKLRIIIIMAITANITRAAIRVITDEPSVPIFHHHCTGRIEYIVFNFRLWCMCCVARAEINVWERPSPGGTLFVRQEGENDDVLVPHPPPTPLHNPPPQTNYPPLTLVWIPYIQQPQTSHFHAWTI